MGTHVLVSPPIFPVCPKDSTWAPRPTAPHYSPVSKPDPSYKQINKDVEVATIAMKFATR
jgi:hypothetical protein